MIYNYHIRNQIKLALDALKSADNLEEVVGRISTLIEEYAGDPEPSACGKHSFYKSTYDVISGFYDSTFYAKKSWFEKIKYFFGFIPKHEKSLCRLILNLKEQTRIYAKQYDQNWLRINFFIRFLFDRFKRNPIQEQNEKETLRYISHRVMGIVPLKHKALNGNSMSNAINDYKTDLEAFLDRHSTTLSETEKQKIGLAIELLDRSQNMDVNKLQHRLLQNLHIGNEHETNRIEDAAFLLAEQVYALKKGEPILFPYGYVTNEGGHATLIQIARMGDDLDPHSFLVKIYNTGAGSDKIQKPLSFFHYLFSGESMEKSVRCAKLKMNDLLDGSFLRGICGVSFTEFSSSESGIAAMNAPIKELKLEDSDEKYVLQTNGTCSHACIDAWFSNQLSKETIAAFQLDVVNNAMRKLDIMLENRMKHRTTKKDELDKGGFNMLQKAGELRQAALKERLTTSANRDATSHQQALTSLNDLRAKKGKPNLNETDDLQAYANKKILRKMSDDDKAYALGQKERIGNTMISTVLGFFSKPSTPPRVEKARLAFQIANTQKRSALAHCVLRNVPQELGSVEAIKSEIMQLQKTA